jgi:homoserine kinase
MITIRIPATTSNLGPGFDVFGMALSLYLTVKVEPSDGASQLIHKGQGAGSIPVDQTNLIRRALTHVAQRERCHPPNLFIEVNNEIPIARGLGSSGAAVVAGIMIADQVCHLKLSQEQMLADALELEGHPDNTTAALVGGLVACCVAENGQCLYARVPFSPQIRAVVVVPDFELSTAKARAVLPKSYSHEEAVFNLQRAAILAAALKDPQPALIAEAMRDRFHQPYRKELIPGLQESLDLRGIPGLLGVSLSGAGPSILALAVDNFREIGENIKSNFDRHGIRSEVLILDIEERGAEMAGNWE